MINEWTGLPSIKERKVAASMSMVGGQGNIWDMGAKVVLAVQGDVHVLKQG